ncbi:MAG: sterol desaturase family protein [Myxococcales bacterium]|nr:sterol desaturase family protein [Myxococcales bacterium]MCB9732658.1 sterol desaturase family protein [Deltaproteobacteria bacterium]
MLPFAIALATGAALWTLLEYVLHRFGGHVPRGRIELSREHLAHHTRPTYFTPPWKKALLAVPTLSACFGLGALAVGVVAGGGFALGVAGGWLTYEVWHRTIHVRAPRSRWARRMARHHLAHHFGHPNDDHGVTVALWDRVFGTYVRPERVRVPARHVLPWMLTAAGELDPRWADDYVIVGRRGRGDSASSGAGAADLPLASAPIAGV